MFRGCRHGTTRTTMRKRSFLWMVVLMMGVLNFSLSSCGDDGEDMGDSGELVQKLQGTWDFHSGKETIMGMTITMDKSSLEQIKQMMDSNVEIWDETLVFSGNKVNGETFALNGNQLVLDGMELMDDFTITIKSVNKSKLILHEVISVDGMELVADMEYYKR